MHMPMYFRCFVNGNGVQPLIGEKNICICPTDKRARMQVQTCMHRKATTTASISRLSAFSHVKRLCMRDDEERQKVRKESTLLVGTTANNQNFKSPR